MQLFGRQLNYRYYHKEAVARIA